MLHHIDVAVYIADIYLNETSKLLSLFGDCFFRKKERAEVKVITLLIFHVFW